MTLTTQTLHIPGPSGLLELVFQTERSSTAFVMCHPHPLYGGSMSNKVVTTLCASFHALHYPTARFNFRGVGQSAGQFDHGVGEVADALAVIAWLKTQGIESIILGGFSFGAYVAARVADPQIRHWLLVAPPTDYPQFADLSHATHWSLLTAAADEIVSTPNILAWAKRQPPPQHARCIADASHFFHGRLNELKAFVNDYFPEAP